jgi:hypothetical protein
MIKVILIMLSCFILIGCRESKKEAISRLQNEMKMMGDTIKYFHRLEISFILDTTFKKDSILTIGKWYKHFQVRTDEINDSILRLTTDTLK